MRGQTRQSNETSEGVHGTRTNTATEEEGTLSAEDEGMISAEEEGTLSVALSAEEEGTLSAEEGTLSVALSAEEEGTLSPTRQYGIAEEEGTRRVPNNTTIK